MWATISRSFGSAPKKCSRTKAPSRALYTWYSPSTASSMRCTSRPSLSAASNGSQREPQTTLTTFQPAPRKIVSSSWMILPLPRTGPSRRCRLQLTTKTRLSSCSRPARPIAPSDSGSSVSPSPRNAHTLRPDGVHDPAALQVLHEAGLVDGHDRPEPHRHGGELPELRHEPRVRVRGDAAAVEAPEVVDLLAEASSWDSVTRPSRKAREYIPGAEWPWKKTRSPPCSAEGACQKWLKPTS